jgi:apolipoprotein N-acyltransferase
MENPGKKALIKTYLFGITASLTQFYWIANVIVDDLWPVIFGGLILLTLAFAVIYLLYGILFRVIQKHFGTFHILLFPAIWVILEYIRTLTEISFPWNFTGYALTPILPLAQLASVTGVWGLSYIIVFGNCIILELLISMYKDSLLKIKLYQLSLFCLVLIVIAVWGSLRLGKYSDFKEKTRISLIQSNIDQGNWNGRVSLDTSMTITEQLVFEAREQKPDLIIFPESGVYCYLERQWREKMQVFQWARNTGVPMIIGTLHFERGSDNPFYKYRVYNAVFFLDRETQEFERYFKIRLLPFSEALPFEGIFPIISRLNLGESDFKRGTEEVIFSIDHLDLKPAPFLCYEIIFPDFVRNRVTAGANLLANLTNDGWFGHSTGPYHHAEMSRMRSIENGVSLARCANSGISILVDPVGRILGKTGLYERAVLTADVPRQVIKTFYGRFGNWVIKTAFLIIIIFACYPVITSFLEKQFK